MSIPYKYILCALTLLLYSCSAVNDPLPPSKEVTLSSSARSGSTYDPIILRCRVVSTSSSLQFDWQSGEAGHRYRTCNIDSLISDYSAKGSYTASVTVTDLTTNHIIGTDSILISIVDSTDRFPREKYFECYNAAASFIAHRTYINSFDADQSKYYPQYFSASGIWGGKRYIGSNSSSDRYSLFNMTEVRNSGSYISCWFSADFTMIDSLIAGNNSYYSKSQDMPYVEQFHEEHRVDMIAVHLPVSIVTNDSIIVVRLSGPALKEHIVSYKETKVGLGGPIMFCDSTQWDSVDPIPSFQLTFTR